MRLGWPLSLWRTLPPPTMTLPGKTSGTSSRGFSYHSERRRYDQCVSELRRRVTEEESGNGTDVLLPIQALLHAMGQPDHALTFMESLNSVELVSENETNIVSDVIEVGN